MRNRDAQWLLAKQHNTHGMQTRNCQKAWKLIGGSYGPVMKTGETRYYHPDLSHPITTGRGKDGTRRLVHELMRLANQIINRDKSP